MLLRVMRDIRDVAQLVALGGYDFVVGGDVSHGNYGGLGRKLRSGILCPACRALS